MKKFLALALAVMMVLSTVSFAAPSLVNTNINVSELFEEVPALALPEEKAELEADELGVLIVNVDFENAEKGLVVPTSTSLLASEVGTTNYPEGFPNLYFKTTQKTLTVVENEDGTKSGEWVIGDAGYGKIGFHTMNPNLMPEGIYTLKGDVKWNSCKKDDTDVKTPSFNIVWTPNKDNGVWFDGENNIIHNPSKTTNAETGFITYSATRGYYENELIKASAVKDENGTTYPYPFKGFGKVALYYDLGNAAFTSANLTVDNIKLYYKAPDVTVTIDDNDASTENKVFNLVSNSQSLDLTPYALASDSEKVFMGYKVAGTSDALTTFAPTAAGNYTLVPIYNYYAPGLGFNGDEFNDVAELGQKVWAHSGEKPNYNNPKFGFHLNKDAGTVLVNVDYDENNLVDNNGNAVTFPAITAFNTHLSKQINDKLVLNTNAIKGVEYRYRLIAPEGAENASRYFTSANAIKTKVYFKVNWPEGMTETPCYNGESINGWHWGECVGQQIEMVKGNTDYNGEWLTAQINLDSIVKTVPEHGNTTLAPWKDADKCSDFRIQFISDTMIMGDFTLEIDYVKFILADGLVNVTPEYVSSNFYDLRKGYFDVTFAEELEGINADEVYNIVASTDFVASELISTEGGATYRFYANSSLANKTVTFKDNAFTSTGVIIASPALKAVTHTYTLSEAADKHDGENLFPNGDFSNPYYVVFSSRDYQTLTIADGKLTVALNDKAAEWSTLAADGLMKLNPDTHYYVDVDVEFTKDSEGEPHKAKPEVYDQTTLYFPVLEGAMSFGFNTPDAGARIGTCNYIPSTHSSMSYIAFNNEALGADKPGITKVIDIKNNDYYANTKNITFSTAGAAGWSKWSSTFFDKASLYLQPCFTNGIKAGIYTKDTEKNTVPGVNGLEYTINKIVVKEMFPVTFMDGETVLGTYYAAKDVPIVLPATTKFVTESGESITGWTDGTNTYKPEQLFTLTNAGAATLTAVTEKAPVTSDEISIRTDAYTGIRFKASVTVTLKNDEKTSEFGYVVTRKVLLDAAGVTVDNFTLDSDVMKLTGKTYIKGSLDKVFANDGSYNYFTAVVYNIPEDQYEDILVARPYLINDGTVTYGAPIASSLKEAAIGVKGTPAYNDLADEAKAVVDKIAG